MSVQQPGSVSVQPLAGIMQLLSFKHQSHFLSELQSLQLCLVVQQFESTSRQGRVGSEKKGRAGELGSE
jgi:hypothetical protein